VQVNSFRRQLEQGWPRQYGKVTEAHFLSDFQYPVFNLGVILITYL